MTIPLDAVTKPVLFFGVGAGRCGTMALANALSLEPGVVCTHEGKLREFEAAGAQLMPFLTLQNRLAYEEPGRAQALFDVARAHMGDLAADRKARFFGDIAYNYAPFLDAMAARFPAARLIVVVRNGVDFVRSATQVSGIDETPVGWAPQGKDLTPVERFVELGRMAPRASSELATCWPTMDHFARNAWLWAETNRLISGAAQRRPAGTTRVLRFEEFFANPTRSYAALREFLQLPDQDYSAALDRLRTPINRRAAKAFGPPDGWSEAQRDCFRELAGSVMRELDYPLP